MTWQRKQPALYQPAASHGIDLFLPVISSLHSRWDNVCVHVPILGDNQPLD